MLHFAVLAIFAKGFRFKQLIHTDDIYGLIPVYNTFFSGQYDNFKDLIRFKCRAGNGGDPSNRSVRSRACKGPGYGGHGGSIYVQSSLMVDSLLNIPSEIVAENGGNGGDILVCEGRSRGLHGQDTFIQVPIGTILRERYYPDVTMNVSSSGFFYVFVYQFLKENVVVKICRGGLGGVGPRSIRTNDGRKGALGEVRKVELELRIKADVALIGFAGSGKSSLHAAMTSKLTRIGPEPYSTTRPHLGTIKYFDGNRLTVVDLPPLFLGAHADESKGWCVLRHSWRSKVFIFVVDMSDEARDPLEVLGLLRKEVGLFDKKFYQERFHIVVGTKCDRFSEDTICRLDSLYYRLRAREPDCIVVGTSARFGLGIDRLVEEIRQCFFPSRLQVLLNKNSLVENQLTVPASSYKQEDRN